MLKRILKLLFTLSILSLSLLTTPARAEDNQPSPVQTFLPTVHVADLFPYNVKARDLILVREDMTVDDFDLDDEQPLQLTEETKSFGISSGYATSMSSNEEKFGDEPLAINSYVLVFNRPDQAKIYYDRQIEALNHDLTFYPFEHEQRMAFHRFETIQGFTIRYVLAFSYKGNVVAWTYKAESNSMRSYEWKYVDIMLAKLPATQ